MGHHFGLAARAAGEVHQHYVVVGVDVFWAHKLRCLGPLLVPVVEVLRHLGANAHEYLYARALWHGLGNLLQYVVLADAYYGFDVGPGVAVYNVVLGKHVRGRNGHCTYLVEGQHRNPEFIASFEYEHHHVALAYAQLHEVGGGAVALFLDVGKC